MSFQIDKNFQTPPVVAAHMVRIAFTDPYRQYTVLEPTPGLKNIVGAINDSGNIAFGPDGDYWIWSQIPSNLHRRYDAVVMNPPFNPMTEMIRFVRDAMTKSDKIVALLPWSYIVNSEKRLQELMDFGLVSVTSLPRKTFPGARVQVALFHLVKGHKSRTEFLKFSW